MLRLGSLYTRQTRRMVLIVTGSKLLHARHTSLRSHQAPEGRMQTKLWPLLIDRNGRFIESMTYSITQDVGTHVMWRP